MMAKLYDCSAWGGDEGGGGAVGVVDRGREGIEERIEGEMGDSIVRSQA